MTQLKSVLLVTDLEGVTGVTDLDALTAGTRKYKNASRALLCEVGAVCRGLLARGVEKIVISDSHRGGSESGNLDCKSLPEQCTVVYSEDAYDSSLFVGIDALIAIGMHGAAGTSSFAAHTVGLHCDWWRAGQRMSESDILLGLAYQAGVPTLFFAGDAELGQSLQHSVGEELVFLPTKTSLSVESCQSLSIADTEPEFYRLAKDSQPRLLRPRCLDCPPDKPILIGLKSFWQADIGETLGAERDSRHWIRTSKATPAEAEQDLTTGSALFGTYPAVSGTTGESFREHYTAGLSLVRSTAGPLLAIWNCPIGSPRFLWFVRRLFARQVPVLSDSAQSAVVAEELRRWPLSSRIQAAWTEFASLTANCENADLGEEGEFRLALRGLVLHICQHCCPEVFAELNLGPHLTRVLQRLTTVAQDYPSGLCPSQAMSRLDAAYILKRRSLPFDRPNRLQLKLYLEKLSGRHTLLAWMNTELASRVDCSVGLKFPERPYRLDGLDLEANQERRLWDLYWLTHKLFFSSEYLTHSTPGVLATGFAEELLDSVDWIIQGAHWDLGVEVALCLEYTGEASTPEFARLLVGLLKAQSASGRLVDNSMNRISSNLDDHATGLLLLLLARIDKKEVKSAILGLFGGKAETWQ